METQDVRFERDFKRCPFCHEGIELEAQDWVACKQCLARHHSQCWIEPGRCASCGCTVSMKQEAPSRPGLAHPAPEWRRGIRGDTRFLFDAILGSVTLGLVPMIASELRLSAHLRRHRDSATSLAWAEVVLSKGAGLALRVGVPFLLYALGLAVYAVRLVMIGTLRLPGGGCVAPEWWDLEIHDVLLLAIVQFMATMPVVAFLHLFRDAVRQHEVMSLNSQLPLIEAEGRLAAFETRWARRRRVDLLLSLLALVPGVGLLASAFVSARITEALEHHEENETDRQRAPRDAGGLAAEAKAAESGSS